jgi:U6 snRNA-associated Sm-like protein LSm2
MLFYSYFKTLVGKEVTVELKNDLAITGILHSVDQYLNVKLDSVRVVNEPKYPQMMSVKNCFIRGSVVRYVQVRLVTVLSFYWHLYFKAVIGVLPEYIVVFLFSPSLR